MFLCVFNAPLRGDACNKAGVLNSGQYAILEEAMNAAVTTAAAYPKVQYTFYIIDTTTGQVVKTASTPQPISLDWK